MKPLVTCELNWHVSHGNSKRCDCGERTNPAYRWRFRRWLDRRTMLKREADRHKGSHVCHDLGCHGFRDNRMD